MKASIVALGLAALVIPAGCCAVSPLPLQQVEQDARAAPSVGAALAELGRAYAAAGRAAEAESAYLQAIDSGDLSDPGAVWARVGNLRYEGGDLDGAAHAFRQAEGLDAGLRDGEQLALVGREAALRQDVR